MSDWVEFPEMKENYPRPGERVAFLRNGEISEPLIVESVDAQTKTIFFVGSLPHDIRRGDELVSLGRKIKS